jgi:hypothetical protein
MILRWLAEQIEARFWRGGLAVQATPQDEKDKKQQQLTHRWIHSTFRSSSSIALANKLFCENANAF